MVNVACKQLGYCLEQLLAHLDCEVTPWTVHFSHICPHVGGGAVSLAIVHPGDSVKPSNGVDEAIVRNHPDPAPSVTHWCQQCPLVVVGVVVLGCI